MNDGTHEKQTKIDRLADAFERAGIEQGDSLVEMAEKFDAYFPPRFRVVESTDNKCVIAITTCVDASLISCVINGDGNFEAYSYPEGMEHSMIRIGNNALVVAHYLPGEGLFGIEKVIFTRPVPLGTEVHISLTKQGKTPDGRFDISLMEGLLPETGKAVFAPSTIYTYTKK